LEAVETPGHLLTLLVVLDKPIPAEAEAEDGVPVPIKTVEQAAPVLSLSVTQTSTQH
jgi:hypothetical protein